MQFIFTLIGFCASIVMVLASVFMNYLFLSSFGKTPLEGEVLGAVSASADILKAVLPFFIVGAWRLGRVFIAVPGVLVCLFFAGFSLLSAIGFNAQNRMSVKADARDSMAQKSDIKAEIKRLKNQRASLPPHRPVGVVNEAIKEYQHHPRWASTKGCTAATVQASRDYCKRHHQLKAELAAGKEALRLDEAIKKIQVKAQTISGHPRHQGIGAQVILLSDLFQIPPKRLEMGLIVTMAVLVELGSSLGPYLSLSHQVSEKGDQSSTQKPIGLIEDFCLSCLVANPNSELQDNELYSAYHKWCEGQGFGSLKRSTFKNAFENLADEVGIPKHKGSYQGIALI